MSTLRKVKVAAAHYDLINAEGEVVATVARTGEYGRDPYPWEWYLAHGIESKTGRATGVTDTMSDAVERVKIALGVPLR